jgi:uncharacterized protein YegL
MHSVVKSLMTDPYALETAYLSVIAFAGKAETLLPLTEVGMFNEPKLAVGSGTSLGRALMYLMNELHTNIKRTTAKDKGDWKPIIFLFTDGMPTDDPSKAIERWQREWSSHSNLVVVTIGDNVDTSLFGRLTENIFRVNDLSKDSIRFLFDHVTDTILTSSLIASENRGDNIVLPYVDGINLEKVDPHKPCKVDENFAVFHSRCSVTKQDYLIKYAKRGTPIDDVPRFLENEFKLVGAYPIDKVVYERLSEKGATNRKINTSELLGAPVCPCCGNQYGLVLCSCGKIFCVGEDGECHCPWCGSGGLLSIAGEEGLNLSRTRG